MKKSGKPVDLFIVGLGVDGQFTHDFLLDKLKNLTYKIYAKSEIQDFYNIYKQDALALKLEIIISPLSSSRLSIISSSVLSSYLYLYFRAW